MAEPIANDWKAIHDRMQQIRAEQSAFSRPAQSATALAGYPTSRAVGTPKRWAMPFAGSALTRGSAPTPACRRQMTGI